MRRAAALLGPFAAILLLFVAGETAERARGYRQLRREPERPLVDTLVRLQAELPRAAPGGASGAGGVPVYDLQLGPKQLRRLRDTAEQVQARGDTTGIVLPGYERAHFLLDGSWLPIRIKLRGWAANHYHKAYPSLRLQFPARQLLHGRRQVNLVDPYDKFITADVTTRNEAERHGVLTWRSGFVILRVNGDVWGEYLEIEQPGRELLEARDRPEGPIFSTNGKVYGTSEAGQEKAAALLDRIRSCMDGGAAAGRCDWALFRGAFDTDRLAWAAAIMGLSGHWGAWLDDNVRLYFDPGRGRFEPIPWDYGFLPLHRELVHPADWPPEIPPDGVLGDGESVVRLGAALLAFPEFRRMRDERLYQLATERVEPMVAEAERTFLSFEPGLRNGRRQMGAGAARRIHDDFIETLRANAALLRDLLGEASVRVVQAPPALPGGPWRFRLENTAKPAVEVLGFSHDGREERLREPVQVPGRWKGRPGVVEFAAPLPAGFVPDGILARNGISGAPLAGDKMRRESRETLPPPAQPSDAAPPLRVPGATVRGHLVRFGPGTVRLDASLEIPEGYSVRFEPGLDLRLGAGVSLIVHGDLISEGTSQRPVRVRGTGAARTWGTLAVLGSRLAPARVSLAHTLIEGGSEGETEQVTFTGAFAVHDGTVTLENSRFLGARGEDGINLKHASIDLRDCEIRGSASDAVDLDFCHGTVARCRIEEAGGDGIDLSGSQVELVDNRIARVGDKGLSIGERSTVTIRRTIISEAAMGIAVKDASVAEVSDSQIAEAEVGVGVYVKKPSYGSASARLGTVRIDRVASRFLRDPDCEILVEGVPLR